MAFQTDTITFSQEFCGENDVVLVNGNFHTILGVGMQQSNNSSNTTVECGDTPIAKNYATNYSHVPMNYQCNDNIELQKTGQDCSFVIVNYIPALNGNYATSTYNSTTNIASSDDIQLYGSFTAGEIVISFFILCLIVISLARLLVLSLSNIKTKKTYLQYGGGDVEIRNDL